MLNKTHLEHAAYALAYQIPVALLTGTWWWAGAIPVAFFIAREHAQREYQITGGGPVNGLKPWQGFTGWTLDAKLDVIAPAVAVCIAALINAYINA